MWIDFHATHADELHAELRALLESLAVEEKSHGLLRGEILLHVPVGVRAEIRVSADGVPTRHQPCHAVSAQRDRGERTGCRSRRRLGCRRLGGCQARGRRGRGKLR